MIKPPQLQEALRLLLLPARPAKEEACADVLRATFDAEGIKEADYLNWIRLQLGVWEESGRIPLKLKNAIRAILIKADSNSGERTGERFERIYTKLVKDHAFVHDEARAFLSHAFLIQDLAVNDNLSAAQLAKLLRQRDGRVRFSRQSISDFLEVVQVGPVLSDEQVDILVAQDKADEPAHFADADITSAAVIVAESARQLGFMGDLVAMLLTLYAEEKPSRFTPYLQILHYQCVLAEFFDHALTDFYEFSPRGHNATRFFDIYPASMATAGNPFLNNAKSVEKATISWVRSKKIGQRPGAAALLSILEGMEAMGFAARRELARSIRLWLHRAMRLSEPLLIPLPAGYDATTWTNILKACAVKNTGTYGVLEQRIVDAAAAWKLKNDDGWRERGLGAAVNATNFSQRKIGDCDFQHPAKRQLEAFEAHGGDLSQVYVDEHLRTMKKIVPSRAEELAGIADLAEWRAKVLFIAHSVSATALPTPQDVGGLLVTIEVKTYNDIIEELLESVTPEHLDHYILRPIREKRTPVEVREVLKTFSGSTT